MTQRVIEELTPEECLRLVGQHVVGRIVFVEPDGPAAVPVNYALVGDDIVFRTSQDSRLRTVLTGAVAFEVDHVDEGSGVGWSVLIRGTAEEVSLDQVPRMLEPTGAKLPKPWAEGVHNVWIRVTAQQITGRRLTDLYFAAIF